MNDTIDIARSQVKSLYRGIDVNRQKSVYEMRKEHIGMVFNVQIHC